MPLEQQMEERFKEKFFQDTTGERIEGWLAMDTTEYHNKNGLEGKWAKIATPDDLLAFIHQERQLAKKECILGLIDELSLVPVKNTYLLASDLHYYAKQNNITLE